ncbi:M20/M25/M40 family metallo-hydrolase [Candidatus Micrarchaeota archaeon]|nr:M20/M25/M40 family metallo-hydrolase [Candidatus Micrarchaeota archaeon]
MDGLGLLSKIVSIDSVFPHEAELAHFLAGELKEAGFAVDMQEFTADGRKRYNVLAARGEGDAPLLLYGHMDTVPAYGYDAAGGRDPFRLVEQDGKLFGLGAYDMKAGVAAILQAVSQVRTDKTLKVMFVSDEEADSRGCFEAVRSGFLKGARFALAAEISDVHDVSSQTRTITLGRRGRAQYELDVPGLSFHAARASEGVSAISEASRLALEIERANDSLPTHPDLGQGHMFVRSFHSESASLSLPDSAKLLVDRHLVPPEDAESARVDIENRIRSLYGAGAVKGANGRMASVRVKPRDVPYLMPYATPKDNPDVARLARTIERTLGGGAKAAYNYGLSVADENLIAMQGVPVASFGPIGGGEHSSGEWVSKQSYLELIDVLKAFIA